MAVFTPVTATELKPLLAQFDLGEVLELVDIASGIENSNFFLTTYKNKQHCEYVLTLFERLSAAQLPFYLELMQHLARQQVLVASPVADRSGRLFGELHGKPASVVHKLSGRSIDNPEVAHCRQVGAMLAHLHLAGRNYPRQQANLRSLTWWQQTVPLVQAYLPIEVATLLNQELVFQQQFFAGTSYSQLPGGPTHCDLFRNNVLFAEIEGQDQLSGFFDFYFAACDKWLFDIAVTVNDWCIDAAGELNQQRTQAFLQAYHLVRPLSRVEENSWRAMLRAAAFRFWISRLWDFYLPRAAKVLVPHDPGHFEKVLKARISTLYLPWVD